MPARGQMNLALFDDRDAVPGVVVAVAGAGILPLAGPAAADVDKAAARLRVVDLALRGLVTVGPLTAAAEVHGESAVADVHVAGRAGRQVVAAEIERDRAGRGGDLLAGNLIGDDVDQAADGVGAVEQRRRAAHHLDALGRRRIHRHAVIARLARQVAHPLAVLHHQHPVAVEAADHRPRRPRPERAHADAGFRLQRRADRVLQLAGEIFGRQHRGRLVRLELRARVGAHRQHFGEMQVEVHLEVERGGAAADGHLGTAAAVALGADRDVVRAGGQAVESIGAVLGRAGLAAQLLDHHRGAAHRVARPGAGDLAGQAAGLGRGRALPTHSTTPPRAGRGPTTTPGQDTRIPPGHGPRAYRAGAGRATEDRA